MKLLKVICNIILMGILCNTVGCQLNNPAVNTDNIEAQKTDLSVESASDNDSESVRDIYGSDDCWNPANFWFYNLSDFYKFADTGSMDEMNFETFPEVFYGQGIEESPSGRDDENKIILKNTSYDLFVKSYIPFECFIEFSEESDEYSVSLENPNGTEWWNCKVYDSKNKWRSNIKYSTKHIAYDGMSAEEYYLSIGSDCVINDINNSLDQQNAIIIRTVNGVDTAQTKLQGQICMFYIEYERYCVGVSVELERISDFWQVEGHESVKAFLSEDEEVYNAAVQKIIESIDAKMAAENES